MTSEEKKKEIINEDKETSKDEDVVTFTLSPRVEKVIKDHWDLLDKNHEELEYMCKLYAAVTTEFNMLRLSEPVARRPGEEEKRFKAAEIEFRGYMGSSFEMIERVLKHFLQRYIVRYERGYQAATLIASHRDVKNAYRAIDTPEDHPMVVRGKYPDRQIFQDAQVSFMGRIVRLREITDGVTQTPLFEFNGLTRNTARLFLTSSKLRQYDTILERKKYSTRDLHEDLDKWFENHRVSDYLEDSGRISQKIDGGGVYQLIYQEASWETPLSYPGYIPFLDSICAVCGNHGRFMCKRILCNRKPKKGKNKKSVGMRGRCASRFCSVACKQMGPRQHNINCPE
jgi:hypothetical protein